MKISVILATLNEEQYIRACLDSFLNQELQENIDIEIILADGGSTDATRQILDDCNSDVGS